MEAGKKRIWIRGQYVEVTDEVYMAYTQGDRKMRYFENDLKTERFVLGKEGQVVRVIPSREDSLDRLMDENAQQFPHEESVENTVLHNYGHLCKGKIQQAGSTGRTSEQRICSMGCG